VRRTRKILLSQQTLAQMFDLPPGAVVHHIGAEIDPPGIALLISHPGYDEVPDNAASPIAIGEVRVVRVSDADDPDAVPGTYVKLYYRWELHP
jgi:hypothetical protein